MSWLTKEFLANTQAKSGTSPFGPFAAFMPNQARNMPQQNTAQAFDLQEFGREQLAAQRDHMKMLVDAIAKPRGVQRLGIDGRPEDPNKKTGLDGFYQMNPHLARSTENPTSAADFNKRVYGEGGRWGGVGGGDYGAQVQAQQAARAAEHPIERYGSGFALTPEKGTMGLVSRKTEMLPMGQQSSTGGFTNTSFVQRQGGQPGTTVVNGVQTPLASFLLGAGRAQQKGQTSGNYQMGLTPEDIKKMVMNPAFGKRM